MGSLLPNLRIRTSFKSQTESVLRMSWPPSHRSERSFLCLSLWQRSLLGQCWSADELITQTSEAHQDCYLCGVFALVLCQIVWRAHLCFCCSRPVCSRLPVSVQFLFWWLAFPLWIPDVCISNHCPAHCSLLCQGLLTLSKTHDSDCPVYSLSTLFNKLFSAFATGFRIYFLTLSGLHKRVCCRFLYVVFINFSKYYNL